MFCDVLVSNSNVRTLTIVEPALLWSADSFSQEIRHGRSDLFLDRGQTREICEKQEKYFKGKVVTFIVHSLILNQYPVDLLTFFELY